MDLNQLPAEALRQSAPLPESYLWVARLQLGGTLLKRMLAVEKYLAESLHVQEIIDKPINQASPVTQVTLPWHYLSFRAWYC